MAVNGRCLIPRAQSIFDDVDVYRQENTEMWQQKEEQEKALMEPGRRPPLDCL